VTGLALS